VTTAAPAVRLTQFAHGGGCACKIPPGELEELLSGLSNDHFGQVVVGLDGGDDAAVVRIEGDQAVVATADFFTPVVDDPYDWGRIAAANALSDVYAMRARPVVALALAAFPTKLLPPAIPTKSISRRAETTACSTAQSYGRNQRWGGLSDRSCSCPRKPERRVRAYGAERGAVPVPDSRESNLM